MVTSLRCSTPTIIGLGCLRVRSLPSRLNRLGLVTNRGDAEKVVLQLGNVRFSRWASVTRK